MPRLRFLAAAYDTRPGKETTVYGPGHETDFSETDYEYAIQLRNRGYAEIIDPTGLPLAASPEIRQEPIIPPSA